jgi:hypothetical protein
MIKIDNDRVSLLTGLEYTMKPKSHIVDLLSAAKLLADDQSKVLLSYIINMAMIEATTGAAYVRSKDGKTDVNAA